MNSGVRQDRSLGEVLAEIRSEVIEFVDTRLEMLRSEMQEAVKTVQRAVPSLVAGLALLGTAYILLTLAIVALVAVAFWNSPYHWFFALLIVGILWAVGGGLAMFMAIRAFRMHGLAPKKTIQVLKADKIWLQHEARSRV